MTNLKMFELDEIDSFNVHNLVESELVHSREEVQLDGRSIRFDISNEKEQFFSIYS